jgi:hypothetical protein
MFLNLVIEMSLGILDPTGPVFCASVRIKCEFFPVVSVTFSEEKKGTRTLRSMQHNNIFLFFRMIAGVVQIRK